MFRLITQENYPVLSHDSLKIQTSSNKLHNKNDSHYKALRFVGLTSSPTTLTSSLPVKVTIINNIAVELLDGLTDSTNPAFSVYFLSSRFVF